MVVPCSNLPLSDNQLDLIHSPVPTNLKRDEKIPKYVALTDRMQKWLPINYSCMGCMGLLMKCFQELERNFLCNLGEKKQVLSKTGASNVSAKKCLLSSCRKKYMWRYSVAWVC